MGNQNHKNTVFTIGGLLLFFFGALGGYYVVQPMAEKQPKTVVIKKVTGYFANEAQLSDVLLVSTKAENLKKNKVIIYQHKEKKRKKMWESPLAPVWDVALADVDGDGIDELALCLYKIETHDPKKDNRLQIYAWGKNGMYAKWRGTFLCRPFKQVSFADLNNDEKAELISLETWKGKDYLCVYSWNGFGFDLVTQSVLTGNTPGQLKTQTKDEQSEIKIQQGKNSQSYKLVNNRLILVEG